MAKQPKSERKLSQLDKIIAERDQLMRMLDLIQRIERGQVRILLQFNDGTPRTLAEVLGPDMADVVMVKDAMVDVLGRYVEAEHDACAKALQEWGFDVDVVK